MPWNGSQATTCWNHSGKNVNGTMTPVRKSMLTILARSTPWMFFMSKARQPTRKFELAVDHQGQA